MCLGKVPSVYSLLFNHLFNLHTEKAIMAKCYQVESRWWVHRYSLYYLIFPYV